MEEKCLAGEFLVVIQSQQADFNTSINQLQFDKIKKTFVLCFIYDQKVELDD